MVNKILKTLMLLCLTFVLTQCAFKNPTEKVPPERAVYYWQTTMNFDNSDDSLANNLKISTIYVRYFDIDWSFGYEAGIPVGELSGDWNTDVQFKNKNIVPTIFITNRTFKYLDNRGLEELAKNTAKKIDMISDNLKNWYLNAVVPYDYDKYDWEEIEKNRKIEEAKFKTMISEIQIDCDWTASTKDKFFKFLDLLKPQIGDKQLSCTIRLHQYRDRELMGIPPVDRGLLMCYNVAEVQKYDTKNAILDTKIVKQYLIDKEYPMRLDVGLPMFSWAAWYRGTEFKGIVSGWNEQDAADKSLYRSTKENRYLISADTVMGTHYLREGDMLRWDNSSEAELNATIDLLNKKLNLSGVRIAFFDWENQKIKRHEKDLEKYYHMFE